MPNQARNRDAACSIAARLASTVPIIQHGPVSLRWSRAPQGQRRGAARYRPV
jgi:hypothetical protein